MNNPQSLMRQLALLIVVFTLGISAIITTGYMFSNFQKKLDNKTINLKARIKLGEFIIEDLHSIKSSFYPLVITNKKRTRKIITDRLKTKIESIKSSLKVLDTGGVLRRVVKLNIPGHTNDIKSLIFEKKAKGNISLETIDIYPKLNDLLVMIESINSVLDLKIEYEKENNLEKIKKVDRKIRRFYKSSPAFFRRVMENTRRLLYEGEKELKKIEYEIKEQKRHYSHIEFLIILITILLVFALSYMISRQINKNNRRLNILNSELAAKIKDVQKQEIFTRGVLDTQSSIVVVTDGHNMISANKALFEFFDHYRSLGDFKKKYRCICELFVVPNDVTNQKLYILNKDYDGKDWVEYVLSIKNTPHKVAMYKNDKLHHFNIYMQKKTISESEYIIIVSLNDITHEISHQKRLKVLNTFLKDSIKDVKNLLNNANQGFLSFSKDMIIKKQYSKMCHKFFTKEIAGQDITVLFYPIDTKKRKFLNKTLKRINFDDLKMKNSAMLSLLEKELKLNSRVVRVEYKMIEDETYMLILTDITDKRRLEKKIDREQKILKMVVGVVSYSEEFFELLEDYRCFISNIKSLIDLDKTPIDNASLIYRTIHTFKGLFLQKELMQTPIFLHTIETKISYFINSDRLSNQRLKSVIEDGNFEEFLKKDIDILTDILGDEYFESDIKLKIKECRIKEIEQKIKKVGNRSSVCQDILNDLKNLRDKPLRSLFLSYPKLIKQLSYRLEKPIYPFKIEIDKDIKVSYDIKPFIQSLIHIFRNMMDHGIEFQIDRVESRKDEIATINCSAYKKNDKLHIIIADDGGGIDIEKLKLKAKKFSIETINFKEEDFINLVFCNNFSTKESIDEISGRGMGLATVKEQLEKIGGEVSIKTKVGVGTTFHFVLPG